MDVNKTALDKMKQSSKPKYIADIIEQMVINEHLYSLIEYCSGKTSN